MHCRISPYVKNKQGGGTKALVDLGPWQTAQALAPLAVTTEEKEYARDAERLADHEVDQAFASALRLSGLNQSIAPSPVTRFNCRRRWIDSRTSSSRTRRWLIACLPNQGPPVARRMARHRPLMETISKSPRLNSGLIPTNSPTRNLICNANPATRVRRFKVNLPRTKRRMRQYDSQSQGDGQVAVISEKKHGTLADRLSAWFSQNAEISQSSRRYSRRKVTMRPR